MPSISTKGRALPASPIRKLVPYAEAARAKGRTVYHLNIGQPDIPTPQVALDAIRNFDESVIEYSHSAGFESYRMRLAQYYRGLDERITHEHILVTTGGSEALMFGLMATLNEGDEVIIPEPFYANYASFCLASGASIVPVTSTIEQGFALPSMDAFEQAIGPKTKAIIICNPANPTGYLYTRAELERLRELVLRHDLFLFADEVYREFVYDGRDYLSTLSLEGLDEHLVLVDSVSKRFSMCGVRIGAMVTRNHQVYQTVMKFAQARLSPPTLGQVASEAAMDVPDSYFEEVNREYVHRRDVMHKLLLEIPGVIAPKPGGAFYLVAALPVEDAEDFCAWMLSEFSYENQTVMLAPAAGFYSTPGLGKNQVRIAYVLEEEALRKAMLCLKEGLQVYTKLKSKAKAALRD